MSLVSDVYKEKRICKHCSNSKLVDNERVCKLRQSLGKNAKVQDSESCGCYERKE